MNKTNFYRTDLLIENDEMVKHESSQDEQVLKQSEGIHFQEYTDGLIHITEVDVDEKGETRIQKKKGRYITLSAPKLEVDDTQQMQQLVDKMIEKLDTLLPSNDIEQKQQFLFLGLGNRDITPDAIGPYTMDNLRNIIPEFYHPDGSDVIIYAPGVTIQTGLETAHFVQAIVHEVKPDILIVVDALAARDSNRLCRTIQLTNTGIHPGSGVGNYRKELSEDTLGIPVLAIGIPTVVDGPVMVADAIDTLFRYISSAIHESKQPSSPLSVAPWLKEEAEIDAKLIQPIFGDWATWPHEERMQLLEEALKSKRLQSFISPKEIDGWVQQYADVLSTAISNWLKQKKTAI